MMMMMMMVHDQPLQHSHISCTMNENAQVAQASSGQCCGPPQQLHHGPAWSVAGGGSNVASQATTQLGSPGVLGVGGVGKSYLSIVKSHISGDDQPTQNWPVWTGVWLFDLPGGWVIWKRWTGIWTLHDFWFSPSILLCRICVVQIVLTGVQILYTGKCCKSSTWSHLKLKIEKVTEKGREILAELNPKNQLPLFFHSFFHRPASSRREFWTVSQNIACRRFPDWSWMKRQNLELCHGWKFTDSQIGVLLFWCCRCIFFISLAGGFVEHFLLNTFFSETGDQDLGLDLFDMFFFLQIFPDGRSRVMRVVLCWILIQHPRFQPLETFHKGEKVRGQAK